ncbi:MAG: hypothetical protein ACYSWQ_21775 [Planctomycetota bacterium]|jgi:hypothetical protein
MLSGDFRGGGLVGRISPLRDAAHRFGRDDNWGGLLRIAVVEMTVMRRPWVASVGMTVGDGKVCGRKRQITRDFEKSIVDNQ